MNNHMKQTVQHDPSCADDYDPASISVDEARIKIQQDLSPVVGEEKRSLKNCLNRVLAEDILSPLQVPAYDNSAMDGYAILGADLPDENKPEETKTYEVAGSSFAGKPFDATCQRGQVVRIMTGGVMPKGCDTVVMQEHVDILDEGHIAIGLGHKTGQNVRYAGEDIEVGDVVLKVGRKLMPADLGILASLGIGEVSVRRRLRVAFFSTGDELRSLGEELEAGHIYDSNRYTLFGMLKRQDAEILDMGIIRDDPDALRAALVMAAEMSDVIITSGGVSVGEADYIKPTLETLGNIHFWKVGMKPGRPLTFGRINKAHFFGLPGNPVSVMVTFYQFVQPALQYLTCGEMCLPTTVNATCLTELRKRPGRFEYQRGIYRQGEQGELQVSKTGQQGSGILSSMSQANCFILLPVDATRIEVGDSVQIQLFDGLV